MTLFKRALSRTASADRQLSQRAARPRSRTTLAQALTLSARVRSAQRAGSDLPTRMLQRDLHLGSAELLVQACRLVRQRRAGRDDSSIGIFPSETSIVRLIGAVLLEANDEWQLQHRYMGIKALAELLNPTPDQETPQFPPKAA